MVFGRRRNVLHLRNGQRITIVAKGRDAKVVASRPSFGQRVGKRLKKAGRTAAVAGIITAGTLRVTTNALDSFMRSGLMWPPRYIPAKKLVVPSARQSAAAPQSPAVRKAVEPNESNRPVGGRAVNPNEVRRVREPNAPANRAAESNVPLTKGIPFSPKDGFFKFREEQARLFGVKFTNKAAGFNPSPLLMQEIKRTIVSECTRHFGKAPLPFDPKVLVYSTIGHESNFNPNALGASQDKGLGQHTPVSIAQLRKLGFEMTNPYDVYQNIEATVITFKWLYKEATIQGSRDVFCSLPPKTQLRVLIEAYNQGRRTVLPYTSTVSRIYEDILKNNPFN